MSEPPPSGPFFDRSASGFSPVPPAAGAYPGSTGPSQRSSASSQHSRWPSFAALAIALIATALAIVGWFRPIQPPPAPTPSAGPTYTEQQITDAKAHACSVFETVKRGTTLQTNLPQTDDPAMANAQATHAQLSLVAGGWYLKEELDPATPAPLSAAINELAKALSDVGTNAIAGAKNADPAQATRMDKANAAFGRVADVCK